AGLHQPGPRAADGPAISEGDVPGVAGRILGDRPEGQHAFALGIERAKRGSRPLRRDQVDVEIGARLNLFEVDGEAVAEAEGRAFTQVPVRLPVKCSPGFVRGRASTD